MGSAQRTSEHDDEPSFVFGTGGDNRKTAALVVVGLVLAAAAVGVAVLVSGSGSGDPKASTTRTTSLGGGGVALPGRHRIRGGGGVTPVDLNPPEPGNNPPPRTTVPNGLLGMTADDAVALLRSAHLQAGLFYVCTGQSVDNNIVLKVDREPGESMEQGATVNMDVGALPGMTATVPNLVGMTLEQAREAVRERVLRLDVFDGNPTEPAAIVTSQPAGDLATDAPDDVVDACYKIPLGTTP